MQSNRKNLLRKPIEYQLDWIPGVRISSIREDLDAIEKLGATHINIKYGPSHGDDAYCDIDAVCERLETDEEYAERLAKLKFREDMRKESELSQLKKLRLKYNQ